MTREQDQEEATGDEAPARRAASTGTPARDPHAWREAREGLDAFGVIAVREPRACREARPGSSALHRRGRVTVAGTGPGGPAGVAAARRGLNVPLRHTVGDKRWATLRRVVASQTETAGPAPFSAHGRRSGEGAR
ncbi:DUF6380 family protein [Streptomyces purpurascens]|uniref:Uncharacterized protein n=1 Tax=Streptomyces purpurascens TaxID=1924 RepID=A0ABZ1MVL8_STREF|nr:DUF6380 family protein [Streptomyces purpurascens]MCE7046484.1 hypothetical protein [Streptomyces purpurascens]GHA32132.1 hypothetical protein GCM10010303_48560 [Streptomyces purpurascens]